MKTMNRKHPHAWLAFCLAALTPWAAQAANGKAHEHGVVKLDIAIDGNRLSIAMESPLDNLVGFERAPRNPAEQRRVDDAVARLRDAGRLFDIDAAAGCRLAGVTLEAPILGVGAGAAAPKDGHGDLDADIAFECRDTARATRIDIAPLLRAFPGMQRIDVQLATPWGQSKETVKRGAGTEVRLAKR